MSESEQHPEGAVVRSSSRLRWFLDELHRFRWWVFGLIGGVGIYLWASGQIPEVPRSVKVMALSGVGVGLIAFPYAARLIAWLYSPNNPHVVNLDADGNSIEVWELPPDAWRELEVEAGGELFPLRALYPTWEAKEYDPEANLAEGTWRAGATDLELVVQQGKARSVQGRFEDMAREGLGYRAQYSAAVVQATREVVLSTVSGLEDETIYDGESIQRAVEAELAEFLEERAEADEAPVGSDETESEANAKLVFGPTEDGEGGSDD